MVLIDEAVSVLPNAVPIIEHSSALESIVGVPVKISKITPKAKPSTMERNWAAGKAGVYISEPVRMKSNETTKVLITPHKQGVDCEAITKRPSRKGGQKICDHRLGPELTAHSSR